MRAVKRINRRHVDRVWAALPERPPRAVAERLTCTVCQKVAHYHVGSQAFCSEHRDRAFGAARRQAFGGPQL